MNQNTNHQSGAALVGKARVLFVCLGNICRSPSAEAVFQRKVEDAGLAHIIDIDSAGTGGWHVGEAPDPRSQQKAARRGYDMSQLRARQSSAADFEHFDYILAMDESNLADLRSDCPEHFTGRLQLMLDYLPDDFIPQHSEVPDPYYGGEDGFELVLDLLEAAANNLLADIRARLAKGA